MSIFNIVHLGNGKQHFSTIIDAANDPAPLGNAQQLLQRL
jgi:hypothetical protein